MNPKTEILLGISLTPVQGLRYGPNMIPETPPDPPAPQLEEPLPARDQKVLLVIMGVVLGAFGLCGISGASQSVMVVSQLGVMEAEILKELKDEGVADAEKWVEKGKSLVNRGVWLQMLVQLLTAVAYFWLGIGSLLMKRWAQKILLALGWMWLATTALSFIALLGAAPMFSEMFRVVTSGGGAPGSVELIFVAYGLMGLGINLVPGIVLVLIYSLRDVRLTVRHRDPVVRWTDAIPVPLLALWTLLVTGACYVTAISIGLGDIIWLPLGIQGIFGTFVGVVFGALLGLAAWLVAKLNPLGWWITVSLTVFATFLSIYSVLTFDVWLIIDQLELPELVTTKIQEFSTEIDRVSQSIRGTWLPFLVYGCGLLGLLVWLKQYFAPQEDEPQFQLRQDH